MLRVDAVGALAVLGLERFDSVASLLHRSGHKPANRVALPAHFVHDLGKCRAVLPLEHGDDLSRLATSVYALGLLFGRGRYLGFGRALGRGRLLARLALGGRALGRLGATLSLLVALGFAGASAALPRIWMLSQILLAPVLAVLNVSNRRYARQAVIDGNQAFLGPCAGELGQFLLAGEGFEGVGGRSGGLLGGGERADVVVGINGERHFESPLFRALRGQHMDHSEVLEKQGDSSITRRWRWTGDEGRTHRK
jgi:hypothetical protein